MIYTDTEGVLTLVDLGGAHFDETTIFPADFLKARAAESVGQ